MRLAVALLIAFDLIAAITGIPKLRSVAKIYRENRRHGDRLFRALADAVTSIFPTPLPLVAKWAFRIVIAIQLILFVFTSVGLQELRLVVGVGLIVVVMFTLALVSAFRQTRKKAASTYDALTAAPSYVFPSQAAALLSVDLKHVYALLLFLRRRKDIPANGRGISYNRGLLPFMYVMVFLTISEMGLVAIAVPWEAVRAVLLLVSIVGLIWIFAFMAALKVFPHTVDPAELRLRFGALFVASVPVKLIDSVGKEIGPHQKSSSSDEILTVRATGLTRANVTVTLREPYLIDLKGLVPKQRSATRPVRAVKFFADDPTLAIELIKEKQAEAASRLDLA